MTTLLPFSLLGLCLLSMRVMRIGFAGAPLLVFSTIPCILLGFGLFGGLELGVYFLTGWGLFGVAMALLTGWGRSLLRDMLRDPAFWIFVALAIFFALKFRGGLLYFNDFQNHWGPAVQELVERNVLRRADALVYKPSHDYPPGTALVGYFIISYLGAYSPGKAYFAQALMLCAPLCVVVGTVRRENWPLGLSLAAAYFFFLSNLNWNGGSTGFYLLFADPVMGAWLGAGIAQRIGNRDYSVRGVLYYLPVLCALPLIKKPGLLFAGVLTFFIFIDFLLAACRRRQDGEKSRWAAVALVAILALAPFVAAKSWSWHVEREGLHRTFPIEVSFGRLADSLSEEAATPRDRYTREGFVRMFVNPGIPALWGTALTMADFYFVSGLFLLGAFFCLRPDLEATRAAVACLSVYAGLAVYLAGLLIMYLYVFTDAEAKILSAVWRYASAYNLALGIVVLGYLGLTANKPGRWGVAAKAAIWTLVLSLGLSATAITWGFVFEPLPKG